MSTMHVIRYAGILVASVFAFLCSVSPSQADPKYEEIALKSLEALISKGKGAQQFLSADHILQELGSATEMKGRKSSLEALNRYRTAFPDLTVKARKVFVVEPMVFVQGVVQGTHLGEFGKLKATKKRYSADMLYAAWIQDEQVKRSTIYLAPDILLHQIREGQEIKAAPLESQVPVISGKAIKLSTGMVSLVYGATGYVLAARLAGWQGKPEWAKESFSEMEIKKMREEYKKIKPYTKAISDMKINMDKVYVAGDYLIVWMTAHGTHSGKLGAIKPTHRKISVEALVIGKVEGKELTRVQVYLDENKLLEQLG